MHYDDESILLSDKKVASYDGRSTKEVMYYYSTVADLVKSHDYHMVYIRYAPMSRGLLRLCKVLKAVTGTKIILELPTYPYLPEYDGTKKWAVNLLASLQEPKLKKYVDRIVNIGSQKSVFGIPCTNIDNGVTPTAYTLQKLPNYTEDCLRLIYVGTHHLKWKATNPEEEDILLCAIDRLQNSSIKVTMVGSGSFGNHQPGWLQTHGLTYGKALDRFYAESHIAFGFTEARFDGYEKSSPLKHREYLSRGLPIIIQRFDKELLDCPFAYVLPEDRSKIDLAEIRHWYVTLRNKYGTNLPKVIRAYATKHLSWQQKFGILLHDLK